MKKVSQKLSYNNIPDKQIDAISEDEMHCRTTRNLNNITFTFFSVFLNKIVAAPKKRYLPEN